MASAKSDVATIEGKPQAITIEIPKTAVIVVDMQNDFGSKGGMFDRAGLDISMIRNAVLQHHQSTRAWEPTLSWNQ